jgi:hypothetical protein
MMALVSPNVEKATHLFALSPRLDEGFIGIGAFIA